MFLITAARRSASCFIASAISASRRSIRDAVLSFGSLFIGSGCFASSMIGRPCTRYHANPEKDEPQPLEQPGFDAE
jgi:hypothetical protein